MYAYIVNKYLNNIIILGSKDHIHGRVIFLS